ncbi:MAG: AMP-dependent synthetase and ligase, partial [Caulobacter sp.]|nr:AMP-dependent synthetase and ligase [Caulobacter sp.]
AARTPDGWLVTGDLGRLDQDGAVFVTGRAKDVIIRGGHNIDPGPIEDALLRSPEVLYAAAVGKPDAYAGELPVAYVQLVAGSRLTQADLIALASATISERPAIPKEVIILEKIPLTEVGKPIKVALRQDAAERTFKAALSEAWPRSASGLQVRVSPHPVHGTLVTIVAAGAPGPDQADLEGRIRAVMDQYAFAYEIQW